MIEGLLILAGACICASIGFFIGAFASALKVEDLEYENEGLRQDLIEARHVSAFKRVGN